MYQQARAGVMVGIEQVADKQKELQGVVDKYQAFSLNSPKKDGKIQDSKTPLITLSPAFRWAQSLNETFIEVKFATRLDSPACIDLYD